MIMPMYNTEVCSHLEYCVLFWCFHLKKVILDLEKVQRGATIMIRHDQTWEWMASLWKIIEQAGTFFFQKRNSLWKEIKNAKRRGWELMTEDASIRKCVRVGYTEEGSTLSFCVSKELLGPAQLCFAHWHGRVKKKKRIWLHCWILFVKLPLLLVAKSKARLAMAVGCWQGDPPNWRDLRCSIVHSYFMSK